MLLCNILAISMKALLVGSAYVNFGIGIDLFVKILRRLAAVCRRYVSGVTLGKGIFWGKNSTVSAFLMPPVSGIKFLKHR